MAGLALEEGVTGAGGWACEREGREDGGGKEDGEEDGEEGGEKHGGVRLMGVLEDVWRKRFVVTALIPRGLG